MPRFRNVFVLIAILLAACAPPEGGSGDHTAADTAGDSFELGLPPNTEAAAGEITAERLRETILALSDDALEGRGPASAGDEAARAYLIGELEKLGLEPGAADGSWEQPFDLVGVEAEVPEIWRFSAAGKDLDLAFWDEFIAGSGVQAESAAIDGAELVFVGYGIEAPEYGWDDYKGRDLAGKVLVMLNNDPDWDPQLFEGDRRLYYGRWTYKYEAAARQGAVGAIIIHTRESAGYPWQVVQSSWTGVQFELPAGDEPRVEIAAWTTWDATGKLLALAGHDLEALVESAKSPDFEPVALGIRTSLALTNRVDRGLSTANVFGLLRGGDPELADEVVIYTAHHDHLGRGEARDGDAIYNGARDNASGTAQVLAIARALTALPEPPRRSILFALVGAEEQGLLGSKHYAAHPTFPPGKIAANINFDSANIFGRTEDLVFIGYGKSSLDRVVEAAAALQGREVVGDQFPDRGAFYRSDQFSLAKIGVPAIYLSGGKRLRDADPAAGEARIVAWEATHYHQPSDEVGEDWRFDGMVEDAQVGLFCGLAIAQADALPAWNPGDEFAAARRRALEAVSGGG